MLLKWLFNYISGYLIVRINAHFPERFLNVCSNKGIPLWDIYHTGNRAVRFKIKIRSFKGLRKIAKKTGAKVTIIKRCGLPFVFQKYKKRKFILLASFLLIIITVLLNQFIWDIEIQGNQTITKSEIMINLNSCGIRVGAPKFMLNGKKLKDSMMQKMPNLSWFWAKQDGVRLIVNVVEKTLPPEIFDPDEYCDIIAQKDGIIVSSTVRNGKERFKLGDTVTKGTVLVSGMIDSERNIETRYVQADADIFARVWYEKTLEFPLTEEHFEETGNKISKTKLIVAGKEIKLYINDKIKYENSQLVTHEKNYNLFSKKPFITKITDTYYETNKISQNLSVESVLKNAEIEILKQIDNEALSDAKRTSYNVSYEEGENNSILVTVTAEYLENIAKKVKVE